MRFIVAAFALGLSLASPGLADAAAPVTAGYDDLTQIELSADQIQHYLASMEEMHTAMGDAPADAAQPDADTMAKIDAVAKKFGFKDFADYNTVAGNIELVLDGVDPQTKTYVGAQQLADKEIAELKADKTMTAADRQAALADLNAQLKSATPVKFKSNIDLVLKNYDKLSAE